LAAANKQICRQRWHGCADSFAFGHESDAALKEERGRFVRRGAPLRWLGYDAHRRTVVWRGHEAALCERCWQQSQCPRQFVYPAATHETLLGKLPLNTRAAQFLLQKIRPWIEPAQSYEKNQLGLGNLFLNSLRLAWCWGLLADAVCLLRARALRTLAPNSYPLRELLPEQLTWDWDESG
jgi:hypothetical protein